MTNTLFDTPITTHESRQILHLIRLELRNFKGVKHAVLEADGDDMRISGKNGQGKTTFADAYFWLWTDKDSKGQAGFEIKTLDEHNQPIHNLEHEVTGTFKFGVRVFTMRKVFKEKWTKKRGSATPEFTGHTTDYFWDGVPVNKGEYDKRISGKCDERTFRLLSDVFFFNEILKPEERRQTLTNTFGDVSDAEVIASDPALSPLAEILAGRSVDEHRKVVQSRRKQVNKELEQIPVRISEVHRNLPDISAIDQEALPSDIAKARATRQAKAEELARAEQGGGVADRVKRLREIESAMLDLENELRRKNDLLLGGKMMDLRKAQDELDALERSIRKTEQELAISKVDCEQHETAIEQYRQEWFEIDEREFVLNQESVCPACGQDLPESQLEEARQKALEQFNLRKAEDLEKVNKSGKQAGARLGQLQARAEALDKELKDLVKKRLLQKKTAEKLKAEIAKAESQKPDVSKNPEHQKLAEEREKVLYEINSLKAGNEHALGNLRKELTELEGVVAALEQVAAQLEQHAKGAERISELEAEERRLAAEYERLEHEMYLIDRFTRAKVSLSENSINSRFGIVTFKMFRELVNGGIEPCCETLVNGVPYGKGLNTGHMTLAGLDIIKTLQKHHNLYLPVWIDRAESITEPFSLYAQTIRLVVVPDKLLEITKEVS